MDTFRSNHTLQKLCEEYYRDRLPEDLTSLLRLNRENGKSQSARLKIIKTHFSGDNINLQPFADMKLELVPHVIAWMGRYGIDGMQPEVSPYCIYTDRMNTGTDESATETNAGAFCRDGTAILPHAIAWMGRDGIDDNDEITTETNGRSLLYQFLRGIPSLFEINGGNREP
eukprot:CAMPEP_0201905442 /NCGR_PEP_ID=MMETSP0902-20130614/56515_1 /ASSEMBLY_ACC=CAM_ASM_000551 /TAXON_ID=420261 /ORGANISM="Thalassiosira antarctica, Strain CCMP982" /LENGTH=170 /DNA_ID=CAMNT_0048439555 /DNA_START=37 /DNA_END=553 /DNA_ORIENTATION=+